MRDLTDPRGTLTSLRYAQHVEGLAAHLEMLQAGNTPSAEDVATVAEIKELNATLKRMQGETAGAKELLHDAQLELAHAEQE